MRDILGAQFSAVEDEIFRSWQSVPNQKVRFDPKNRRDRRYPGSLHSPLPQ